MKTMKTLLTVGVLAAATAAAAAYTFPLASAPSPIDRQIGNATIGAYNFDRPVFEQRGELETGGREITFVVLLQAGADYRLAARCGTACVNFNMSIRDARGRELGAGQGQTPVFDFRAPHEGAYTVTLDLASCQTPRCGVEVVMFGRGAPADA
jgi:hypothetical protein